MWKVIRHKFEQQDKIHKTYWGHLPNGIQKIKCNAKLAPYIGIKLAPYVGINTGCTLMHVFFKSQFNYCPLLLMCCDWLLNKETDRLQECCLWIIYSDKTSSCNELLENGGHHGNIRQLAIEMFDVSTGLSPENIRFFQFKEEIH